MDKVALDDGTEEARAAGRARVRELLIVPLAGLKRSGGTPAAEYERLADKLAYMREDALRGLCELVLRIAHNDRPPVGTKAARCPAPALIQTWAYGLQPPPPAGTDYVPSIMRSALGREARDGGWHVELFRHARRVGPPPQSYERGKLLAQADENRRMLERVRERMAAGVATPDDRRWLAAWHDDVRAADALVEEGDARRAAKAAADSEGKAA
ncbi:hypothetical protein [Pseudotabrizicola algicola]|uniref:Uncharacterized protein n=1 Tax=Pseudotabrizicola algicola TaxID=2709381 RepID=A0A6B3RGN9_9RHOB|nr:hypothetical protein [Pseudotabrizicola algicola]NEX45197.1 hypothetical protein [Pseudotabrizicola algicola]